VLSRAGNNAIRRSPLTEAGASPLSIARQGSFFVGGHKVFARLNDSTDPARPNVYSNSPGIFGAGHVVVDQAYVQYQIPARLRCAYPMVLTHGGGHHGGFYEETPDGREGYYTYFARRGFAVYILDGVNRGRSGYDIRDISAVRLGLKRSSAIPSINRYPLERAWTAFGIGSRPSAAHAGSQFPVKAIDAYAAQLVPTWRERRTQDPKNKRAILALLERIGPAFLLTWSQSGPFGWAAAAKRPDLVKGILAMEPSTLPPGLNRTALSRLAKVPVLVAVSEHPTHPLHYYQALVRKLQSAGGRAEVLHLPGAGISGNSHLMAIEKNNLGIAELALARLMKLVKQ
jgi:pimeloyl-ACP methyl ester carboxylesterase